jgi:hypothetical protein
MADGDDEDRQSSVGDGVDDSVIAVSDAVYVVFGRKLDRPIVPGVGWERIDRVRKAKLNSSLEFPQRARC